MYRSRIPQITKSLPIQLDAGAEAAAHLIEAQAKSRAPVRTGALRDAIHVEHEGVGEYSVVAGNTEVFYGHIVEHGGVHSPPHPFMVPALESVRSEAVAAVAAFLRKAA